MSGCGIVKARNDRIPARHRVLIVDDDPLFRAGLRALLAADDVVDVVGEAQDDVEALAVVSACPVDLIVLDASPTPADGVLERNPVLVVVTLPTGARAYVRTSSELGELADLLLTLGSLAPAAPDD